MALRGRGPVSRRLVIRGLAGRLGWEGAAGAKYGKWDIWKMGHNEFRQKQSGHNEFRQKSEATIRVLTRADIRYVPSGMVF
jgi:hypothetical protein